MYIPDLKYTFYGPIVLSAIIIGIVVACLLMAKAGAAKGTCFYTALLTFVMIIMVSFMTSIALNKDIRNIGFVGAGGALGLILGAVTSALIHRDHITESIAAWITSAPLMYGLSKIACHIAGCCNGIPYTGTLAVTYEAKNHGSYFPVQLTETVSFIFIFIIGLILYLKLGDKTRTAIITLILSGITKTGLEFLRESHIGQTISNYQILVLCITFAGAAAIRYVSRISAREAQSRNL